MSDKNAWKPRELVAPNGQKFTPSSAREENDLIVGGGYGFAKAGESLALADADNPPTDAADPSKSDPSKASAAKAGGKS